MKYLRYLFIMLLLAAGSTSQLSAQNISAKPNVICAGDQATLVIDNSIIPSGKVVQEYRFYFGNGATITNQASAPNPSQATFFSGPTGNWVGSGTIVFTSGDSISAGTVNFSIYNRPVPNFSLAITGTNNDTQCFSGGNNSFLFVNSSVPGAAPSNPIISCLWVWGDGAIDNNCSPTISHSFKQIKQYDVVLKVTDDKGCSNDIKNPSDPNGNDLPNGVVMIGTPAPAFKWVQVSGPCFKSCYRFINLSQATIDKINYYQWDFGDGKNLCNSTLETDSNLYTASGPYTNVVSHNDSIVNKFDSLYYDTIIHCYCNGGTFKPMLTTKSIIGGCSDSTRYTPQSIPQVTLPQNIYFNFDVATAKGTTAPANGIIADSVCVGSGTKSQICFKQTPIFGAQVGTGDVVWNFGDPNDPNNKNLDSTTWTPCHQYSAMGSFFPSITIAHICGPNDTTFYYYSATMVGPTRRYLDTINDLKNDILDPTLAFDTAHYAKRRPISYPVAGAIGFDGQAMPVNIIDSVQMVYVQTDVVGPNTFYEYKMVPKDRYYGDPIYKLRDTTKVYAYWDTVPTPYFYVTTPQPKLYSSVRDSLTTKLITSFTVLNASGIPKDTIWYVYSRSYKYGVRVLGPVAGIENPQIPVVIKALQKNQCGPRDTIDFVNTSNNGFKARNIWRRWDFDDDYAPQCTSFSRPQPGWPLPGSIDSFAYYDPTTNAMKVIYTDTVKVWSDALEQFMHSDHYFIMSGQVYPGRRNCKFSHDTLPRHWYPNWDTVYLWYRYGHDFMPWDTTRWTNDPTKVTASRFMVKPWDIEWWGKPIYLNSGTGGWSLTQDSSFYSSTGKWVKWPRVDTMVVTGTPLDRWPGNSQAQGLPVTKVPDPFEMVKGGYYLMNGITLDTATHHPPLTYTDKGRTITLPPGTALMPDGKMDFFEYVFRRTVQRCITVRLILSDSLNNESVESGGPLDITFLDKGDCNSEATVLLALGKPDARGMGKKGKECPGFDKPGSPALVFDNSEGQYPGIQLNCGRTSIYINIDSLADRQDNTPCYLDAFTTWGPNPVITPGGLSRAVWHKIINWPGTPPDLWADPGAAVYQYHMGGNSPNPPAADTLQGLVTIGIYVGNGQKDSVIHVWKSNYILNQNNDGTPIRDWLGRYISPTTGQPYTYQDIVIVDSIVNRATPPPVPILPGWIDDSTAYAFSFSAILSKRPQIRYPGTPPIWDTMYEIEYLDPNWPNCMSDTVWYHDFWHIKELNPNFYIGPAIPPETATAGKLIERGDDMMVIYIDSVQDSVRVSQWDWGDKTTTIDSFYYAGADTTDGYYTHGVRRVRYNMDFTNGLPGVLIDSLEWPCGVYGAAQYKQPMRFYLRLFNQIGTIAPDSLILVDKCPDITHYDPQWYPYSNYFDTIHLRMQDTVRYTQFRIIDTAMMLLPVVHKYNKTSWEMADKLPGATITGVTQYIENTQKCSYTQTFDVTIGFIDTLHIYDKTGKEDTVFCKNEIIYFVDSVRYFRFDGQVTNVPNKNYGRSRGQIYGQFAAPYNGYQFDTIDFWARDAHNVSDTLNWGPNLDLKYLPGQPTTSTVHFDFVVHGGDVRVFNPTNGTDSVGLIPQVGTVIFYRGTGGLGNTPGLYAWDFFGRWVLCYPPITLDTLYSLTDISHTPNPTPGRTLIFNNGKGPISKVGMYYWDSNKWVFVADNPYTSFPYFTHRLYWDFGDSTTPYVGVRPSHNYDKFGRFKVSMVSRDSLGAFDTCISYIEVMKPVARPYLVSNLIGCKDTASFKDSSFVFCGASPINSLDQVKDRSWWFTIKYSYPNGLQGQDTITPQSILQDPVWFYSQKGVYKVKIAIETEQGCRDTASDSLIVEGPRPAFKIITDTVGCKPFRLGIWNLADSFDMRSSSDTPTVSTFFYWGDGANSYTAVYGRRDTVWHTYADTGTYNIVAAGRNTDEFTQPTCPTTYTPDTSEAAGFQREIHVLVREPYRADIVSSQDTVCVGQTFNINNLSDSINYAGYTYERFNDSAMTFIDSVFRLGTSPFTTKFDNVGKYRVVLLPDSFQASVPLQARCAARDTVTITVLTPIADFSMDTTHYPDYKFTNLSTGADHYDWIIYNKDGSQRDKTPRFNPLIDYAYSLGDDTGRFQICLIAYRSIPNQGPEICPDKKCDYINNVYTTKIVIPNVFTPNGDGSNDVFKIDIEGETKYELNVFNRWGNKVFESGDKAKLWNGKSNNDGAECANGTYFFVFNYKLRGQESEVTVHGTITLIREQ